MVAIKQLESEQKGLQGQLTAIESEEKDLKRRKDDIQKAIDIISRKIRSRHDSGLVISEHAILRYLERVKEIDLEEIKALVAPEGTEKIIKAFGGKGTFPIGTHQIVVENNTIKTILT